jgi:hypothetical protein
MICQLRGQSCHYTNNSSDVIFDVEAYLIEPKVSTVNFLSWFRLLVCEEGACALFLNVLRKEIACLPCGLPRYSYIYAYVFIV